MYLTRWDAAVLGLNLLWSRLYNHDFLTFYILPMFSEGRFSGPEEVEGNQALRILPSQQVLQCDSQW
jgi:hypothetical protein